MRKVPASAKLLERYKHICYALLGRRAGTDGGAGGEDRRLASRLKQADYNITPGMYHSLMFTTAALALLVGASLGSVAFVTLLAFPEGLAWGLIVGLAAFAATLVAFPTTVTTRISNRAAEVDKELPFNLSELSVLASIGLPPIALMHKMARRSHDPAMTREFRKVVALTDYQGLDIVQALADTARESPSLAMRETFWDMASMIHQGADLGVYLEQRSQEVLEMRRAEQEQFIERLGTYADMYITVVLMGVMFVGIGAFMMDAFGNTAGGLTAEHVLQLLTFGFVPGVVLVLGILLSSAHGKVRS